MNEVALSAASPEQIELLTHMLGAGSHVKRSNHGYRNYFCAGIGSPDYAAMIVMEAAGLVKSAHKINGGTDQYFFATLEGCKAAGLSKAAIKRAFKD
jgi:hypothetical protein